MKVPTDRVTAIGTLGGGGGKRVADALRRQFAFEDRQERLLAMANDTSSNKFRRVRVLVRHGEKSM
jgi:hypothetical protein